MKRTKTKADPDAAFVEAFKSSTTTADVCRKTGLSPTAVRAKASRLRKAGLELDNMQRGRKPYDIENLAKIAKKARRQ